MTDEIQTTTERWRITNNMEDVPSDFLSWLRFWRSNHWPLWKAVKMAWQYSRLRRSM